MESKRTAMGESSAQTLWVSVGKTVLTVTYHDMVVGVALSFSETAHLLGFSHETISNIYTELCE